MLATTADVELAPRDPDEIAAARWGTLAELAGPLRDTLLATGRAFWRYRVALHDAALQPWPDRDEAGMGIAPPGSFEHGLRRDSR